LTVRPVDETEFGLGWIEPAPKARTSHALVEGGRVWLVDPIEPGALEERVLALGEPAGVIQLLDRHGRDSESIAARLGVPLHVVPRELPGTPFELRPVLRNRIWQEVALWWPERRVLVCADALGTIPFFGPAPSRSGCTRCCASYLRAPSVGSIPHTSSSGTAAVCTKELQGPSRTRFGMHADASRAGSWDCREPFALASANRRSLMPRRWFPRSRSNRPTLGQGVEPTLLGRGPFGSKPLPNPYL